MQVKYFLLGILVSLAIRTFLILNGSEIADIHSLREMADLLSRQINPYLALNYNTYPALALYIQFWTLELSKFLGIPFYILIKLWPNSADLLITFLIYYFLAKKGTSQKMAFVWSLTYFLNPVSILISSAHGQLDSIPTFLVILAILLLSLLGKFIILSALSLGLAISIKPNPLMLLPVFLTFTKVDFKNSLIFLIITVSLPVLLLWPFVSDYPQEVLKRILQYSGSKDFGLAAVIKGFFYFQTSNIIDISQEVLTINKTFFLSCLILFVIYFRRLNNLIFGCLFAYLLFLGLYLGLSAQYLGWVLPFACLQKDKMVILYSIFATISLIGFYLFINPAIIISQFSNIAPYQPQYMALYVLGNFLLWLTITLWLIKLLKRPIINLRTS